MAGFSVAATGTNGSSTSPSIVIPAGVLGGDFMLATLTETILSGETLTDPAGWTKLDQGSNAVSTMRQTLYWRSAAGTFGSASSDVGAAVTATKSVSHAWAMTLTVYTGIDQTSPIYGHVLQNDTVSEAAHPTPALGNMSLKYIIEGVSDKGSSASTAFTPPSGYTIRSQSYRTGSGSDSTAVGDSGTTPTSYGPAGGDSWTGTITPAAGAAFTFTVALLPASSGFSGSASLSGSGSLSASAAPAIPGAATLAGSGSLSASGSTNTLVALSGSGTLSASATPATSGAAALSGSGTLVAAGPPTGASTLSGSGTLSASTQVGVAVQYLWPGGQTSSSIVVTSRSTSGTSCRLGYSTSAMMASPSFVAAQTPDSSGRMRHVVTGLSSNTVYYFRLYDTPSGGVEMAIGLIGTSRTLATAGVAVASRKIVLGGCIASLATDDVALVDAMAWGPDWSHFNGDMFYTGSTSTTDTVQAAQWDTQIAGTTSLEKFLRTGMASFYNVSDHEAGPDNGDSNNAYTQSNINAYKTVVPYGTLLDPSGTTGSRDQQWDDGRVSYFMIDCRSVNRSSGSDTDTSSKTMLGAAQKARLKSWLTTNTAPFKVILSDVQWMGPNDIVAKPDAWWSYDTERQELISFFTANAAAIGHLELWHGDAHCIGYATPSKNTWGGFPILSVAPYNQTGGGRDTSTFSYYFNNSSGAARQFVEVTIADNGTTITRTAVGWDSVSSSAKFTDVVTYNTNAFTGGAALSGSGILTASAAPSVLGTATLSGSGSLSTVGTPRETGAATLSGSGLLSATAIPAIPGAATLSGSGSLSASAVSSITGAATLSGSGTLSVVAVPKETGAATLSGSGTLSASATPAVPGAATLSGSGTLSASAIAAVPGVATLSGSGTLSASTKPAFAFSAAFSGSGTLSTAASLAVPGTATLSGSGSLTAIGGASQATGATLSGSGTLSASGVAGLITGSANFSGSGTLVAGGTSAQTGAATLSGSGTLVASGTPRETATATLSGSGTLVASGAPSIAVGGAFSGIGTLTVSGGIVAAGTATLGGSGILTALGSTSGASNAVFSGSGTLTASTVSVIGGAAVFSGSGTLGASAQSATAGTATLSGTGVLAIAGISGTSGTASLSGSGILTVVGSLASTGSAVFAGYGTLVAVGHVGPAGRKIVAYRGPTVTGWDHGPALSTATKAGPAL